MLFKFLEMFSQETLQPVRSKAMAMWKFPIRKFEAILSQSRSTKYFVIKFCKLKDILYTVASLIIHDDFHP
jgi:hypothetical protein